MPPTHYHQPPSITPLSHCQPIVTHTLRLAWHFPLLPFSLSLSLSLSVHFPFLFLITLSTKSVSSHHHLPYPHYCYNLHPPFHALGVPTAPFMFSSPHPLYPPTPSPPSHHLSMPPSHHLLMPPLHHLLMPPPPYRSNITTHSHC